MRRDFIAIALVLALASSCIQCFVGCIFSSFSLDVLLSSLLIIHIFLLIRKREREGNEPSGIATNHEIHQQMMMKNVAAEI